ncbi:MAG TPA: recombinase family protein, partial [Xanthobacteraceae bacterium]|nr:recombinase family protein [Xanthobacteraceae bacterium]
VVHAMNRRKRVAIYARFSSDLQDARSVTDQKAVCCEYAARQGHVVVQIYADEAVSGASVYGRAAFLQMVDDAEHGCFDIILAEHIDRIARNAADAIRLREQMEFIGVEIHTCASGLVTELHAGLEGLMSALYLKQLAVHVRRGQAGRVREGLAGGGLTYGYAAVPGQKGKRVVVDAEAAIVRGIFASYVGGSTPRAIAAALNHDHVPAPRGTFWSASTIHGNRKRGSGILSNALYDGRLVWNKVGMRKDPKTGKRVSRVNPDVDRQCVPVPHLRIVEANVFAAAQALLEQRSHTAPSKVRAPKHMFSGRLRCGCCGYSLVLKDRDGAGRRRLYCSRMREGGACTNGRAFYVDEIEKRVLAGLAAQLKDPRAIERFLRTYIEERKRLAAAAGAKRQRLEKRLGETKRELDRLMNLLIKGLVPEEETAAHVTALHGERKALEAELAAIEPVKDVVALHPATIQRYLGVVDDLAGAFSRPVVRANQEIARALRELVVAIIVHPNDRGRPEIKVKGRLAALTAPGVFPEGRVVNALVAEDRFEPPTHGSKVGWPKEYDCTERGIHYFVRLKRRSPCLERPGIRPFLSIAHPRSARPGSPPDRESRRSRYTRTVGGIAQAQKFRLLHPDIALGCVALLRL